MMKPRVKSTRFEDVTEKEWKLISQAFGVRVFDFFFQKKYPDEMDNRVKFLKALRESVSHDCDRQEMWSWWETTVRHKMNLKNAEELAECT